MKIDEMVEQEISSDSPSTVILTPHVAELNLAAMKLKGKDQADAPAFNLALGEYMKAMIDSSIQAIEKKFPNRRLDSFMNEEGEYGEWKNMEEGRRQLLNLGIHFSLVNLIHESIKDLGSEVAYPPKSKEEELWRAVSRGDLEIVKGLSEDPLVDVNAEFKDAYGQFTPLNLAATRGHHEIVESLLKNPKVDPNFHGDKYQPCPLYGALKANNAEIAHLILDDPRLIAKCAGNDFAGSNPELWGVSNEEIFVRIMKHPAYTFEEADPVQFILDEGYESDSLAAVFSNPNYDVNKHCYFARCCEEKRTDWIIEAFLAHPKLDVNLRVPFGRACDEGDLRIVEYLLADPRTDVYLKEREYSPFFRAILGGSLEIMKRLLFFGIEVDFEERPDDLNMIKLAEDLGPEGVALLRSYQSDPTGTRVKIRLEFVSKLFAMMVLLCDGYLEIGQPPEVMKGEVKPKRTGEWEKRRKRFFGIAQKLPMELQMIVCHRAYGSFEDSVSSSLFESGFRSLQL